jgi:ribosomal protein L11 methylase PrmA
MLLVGNRLAIVGCWDDSPTPEGRHRICLQPSRAFGNGYHPTTRRLLELIDRALAPGDVVYDNGAGSGILALAAARLGASYVHAVEKDPVAHDSAVANVEANDLSGQISVSSGIPATSRETVDFILCNIGNGSRIEEVLHFATTALKTTGALALMYHGDAQGLAFESYRLKVGDVERLEDGTLYLSLLRL